MYDQYVRKLILSAKNCGKGSLFGRFFKLFVCCIGERKFIFNLCIIL